ncbi:MAG TPA: hypothetical protein VMK66_12310 [Myxococcales bacterium]|nr:hypothetical protein [Myxococcales bacterium]
MKNLDLWLRPALLIAAWVLIAAFTLLQLGTLAPLLKAQGQAPAHMRGPVQGTLEARAHPTRRRAVAR